MVKSARIASDVIRFYTESNCYLIGNDILIDCASAEDREELIKELSKYTDLKLIKKVIFTHLHYDHISNFDLFSSATFYASHNAIQCISDKKDKVNAILNPLVAERFDVALQDIEDEISLTSQFEIFHTPGHTSTSICLYYKKSNVFFTGDTYFAPGIYGRTDLPLSNDLQMEQSLKNVKEIIKRYKPVIAPGHDY
jgi:glyoxylase-like metal-dependent hydrolase (beta-lactamase superfamily II)